MDEIDFSSHEAINMDDNPITSMPVYEDLLNVGFSEDAAREILEEYPDKAQEIFDAMKKANSAEINTLKVLEECGVNLQSSYLGDIDISDNHSDVDNAMSDSCDCRSECKYNTGKTWKYADYGYSD